LGAARGPKGAGPNRNLFNRNLFERSLTMVVADLMTRQPVAVTPDSSLAEAAQLMWQHDCGALPVLERDSTRVIGMITDRDVCMACWSRNVAPSDGFVANAMSQHLVYCHPNESVERAEVIMHANQIRRLPVVDTDERLVGILSLADIARATEAAPKLSTARVLSTDNLTSTLAGICRTRPATTEALAAIPH
jgi:CBS domain-containing protein